MGVKSIVNSVPPPGELGPTPFEVGDIVHVSDAPKWTKIMIGKDDLVVVDEYAFCKITGYINVWDSKYFSPLSDIDDDILSEEECEEVRHRQLTPLKALAQHSLPKGYKIPQTFRK